MFSQYKSAHLPGTQLDDGKVSVVVRDRATGSWREHVRQTTSDDARVVMAQLRALGIPGQTPKVEGVVDTSDGWVHLFVRVKINQTATAFELGMQSSGFDGPDADPLRALFRHLFALAGFDASCPVVYGPAGTTNGT